MRATLAKQYTDEDYARAQMIAEALWKHRELGDGQLSRLVGFKWRTVRDKENSRRKVRNLMGLTQRIFVAQHPGYMIRRPGGGVAEVIDDRDVAARTVLARIHRVYTQMQRADAEASVLRLSTNPVQQEIAAAARVSVAAMGYQFEEAVAKEAQRLNEQLEMPL